MKQQDLFFFSLIRVLIFLLLVLMRIVVYMVIWILCVEQVHIFCWFIPIVVEGYTALSDSRRNITDYWLRKFYSPEYCPICRAIGYNFN